MDSIPRYDQQSNFYLRHATTNIVATVKDHIYQSACISPLDATELLGGGATIETGRKENYQCSHKHWVTHDNGMIFAQQFIHSFVTSNTLIYRFDKYADWKPLHPKSELFPLLNITFEDKKGIVMAVVYESGGDHYEMDVPHKLLWQWLRRKMIGIGAKPAGEWRHVHRLALAGGRNGRLIASWSVRHLIGTIVIDKQFSDALSIDDVIPINR